MWDIAEEFGAMLVFAEHRYYGESLPFGKESKSKDPAKVLNIDILCLFYISKIISRPGWFPVLFTGAG